MTRLSPVQPARGGRSPARTRDSRRDRGLRQRAQLWEFPAFHLARAMRSASVCKRRAKPVIRTREGKRGELLIARQFQNRPRPSPTTTLPLSTLWKASSAAALAIYRVSAGACEAGLLMTDFPKERMAQSAGNGTGKFQGDGADASGFARVYEKISRRSCGIVCPPIVSSDRRR